mgnify:CR=1 FL=1
MAVILYNMIESLERFVNSHTRYVSNDKHTFVYNNIDQTSPLGDDQVKNLQAMDEIRDLKRAHIMRLVKSVR